MSDDGRRLPHLGFRVAGLVLLLGCLAVFDPVAESVAQQLLIPLLMIFAGYALIQNLAVVALATSVLAAIAYPAYQNYARESKRADAHTALLRIAALQEKHFSNNNVYANSTTTLGYAAHPAASNDGYWAVAVTGVGPAAFTLNASPAGSHADADCNTITLTSAGMRTPANCW